MWPFSLFAKATNGEPMTPWERSQYRFLQFMLAALVAFFVTNAPLIQQLLTDPGSTDIWYNVRHELLVPVLAALFLAWQKYNSSQTDVPPPVGTTTKAKASTRIKAQRAGVSDVKTPTSAATADAAPVAVEPSAAV